MMLAGLLLLGGEGSTCSSVTPLPTTASTIYAYIRAQVGLLVPSVFDAVLAPGSERFPVVSGSNHWVELYVNNVDHDYDDATYQEAPQRSLDVHVVANVVSNDPEADTETLMEKIGAIEEVIYQSQPLKDLARRVLLNSFEFGYETEAKKPVLQCDMSFLATYLTN